MARNLLPFLARLANTFMPRQAPSTIMKRDSMEVARVVAPLSSLLKRGTMEVVRVEEGPSMEVEVARVVEAPSSLVRRETMQGWPRWMRPIAI